MLQTNSTDRLREMRLREMRTRGRVGVEYPKNFADVLYEWSLKENTFVDVAMARYQLTFNGYSKVQTFFNCYFCSFRQIRVLPEEAALQW